MTNHELGKATPDQVTTERLHEAFLQIGKVQEFVPEIIDPSSLACGLWGLSRAISDVAAVRMAVESTDPTRRASNTLQVFENPTERTGSMLSIQLGGERTGASIGLHTVESDGLAAICDITLPNDRTIDELLSQDPLMWSDQSTHARNFTHDGSEISYPFHSIYGDESSPATYLKTLQALSAAFVRHAGQ